MLSARSLLDSEVNVGTVSDQQVEKSAPGCHLQGARECGAHSCDKRAREQSRSDLSV